MRNVLIKIRMVVSVDILVWGYSHVPAVCDMLMSEPWFGYFINTRTSDICHLPLLMCACCHHLILMCNQCDFKNDVIFDYLYLNHSWFVRRLVVIRHKIDQVSHRFRFYAQLKQGNTALIHETYRNEFYCNRGEDKEEERAQTRKLSWLR